MTSLTAFLIAVSLSVMVAPQSFANQGYGDPSPVEPSGSDNDFDARSAATDETSSQIAPNETPLLDTELSSDTGPDPVLTSEQQIKKWKSWIEASPRPQAVHDINFRSLHTFITNLKTLISLRMKYDQIFSFMWVKADRARYQDLLDSLYRDMSRLLPRISKPTSEYEISSESWPYRGTLKLQFEEMGVELMLLEMIKFDSQDPFYQRSVDRLLAIGEICRNEFKNWELGVLSRFLNEAIESIMKSDLYLIFGGQMLHSLVDLDPSLKQAQVDFLTNEIATERPKRSVKIEPSPPGGLRSAYRLAQVARKAEIKPVSGDLTESLKPKIYRYNVAAASNLRAIGLLFQVLGQLGRHPFQCQDLMTDQKQADSADLWDDSSPQKSTL